MYAQLCKRLSEEAPNFEPPGQPCTFKLLLLNKCRTEFENRAQAFAAYEDKVLTAEEEEKRHLAKCKMLGNIKFIGELGKLEILAESILHRCIQQLLARRAAAEHHEDLECLAQLVRTCGRVLDSQRGRGLMDQYFARIEMLAGARELAPRIRFMLRDVAELRRGGWLPRAATSAEGPVPIHQLRADDEPPRRDRERADRADRADRDLFRGGLRARPLDDVLAGLSLQPAPLGPDKLFGNGFGSARDAFRQRAPAGYFPRSHQHQHQHHNQGQHYKHHSAQHQNNNAKVQDGGRAGGGGGGGGKARGGGGGGGGALGDVQMRPAANSLMFTANRLSRPAPHAPPHAPLAPAAPNVLTPSFASTPLLLKEPAITIKPAPDKKEKPKKDKGLSKEEACRLGIEAVDALAEAGGVRVALDDVQQEQHEQHEEHSDEQQDALRIPQVQRLRDLQLPDKVLRRVIAAVLEHALAGSEGAREGGAGGEGEGSGAGDAADGRGGAGGAGGALAGAACGVVRAVKRSSVAEPLRALAHARHPHARLPALLAHAVLQKLVTLSEVGSWCEGGQHHPLLLELLQQLRALAGDAALLQLYNESKINLCAYVSERCEGGTGGAGGGAAGGAGGAAGALEALEARGLAFLVPQLRVRAQLARQLASEPAPLALYRWIKANVEPAVRHNAAFVSTLVALVCAHVTAAAGAGGAGGTSSAPDKAALEQEKALAEAYAPLLTALLEGRPDLQLAAVYAVQLHAHAHKYPKGMLLRWFMYLYNLEVCEEEAFLRWREDVTDAYPGKGEALFQVNTWLTWLQQQESEDEEAED